MQDQDPETIYPKSQKEWRQWLKKNHSSKQSVWLIYYNLKSGKPTISWSEAVDEALCFGWIDSKKKPIDGEKHMQFFSKRKAVSTWSKINKGKIEGLIAAKRMSSAGLKVIETAKQNGSWAMLDDVEELKIPADLAKEFKSRPGSKQFFMGLSKSVKKGMLQWIVLAKQEETRKRRIQEIAEQASKKLKPKQF